MDSIRLISWLLGSRYRVEVLKLLSIRPMLPSEIAYELGLSRSSVSRILRDLAESELVYYAQSSRVRLYFIAEKGKEAIEELARLRHRRKT